MVDQASRGSGSAPPSSEETEDETGERGRRRRVERLIREGIRSVLERGLEAGIGTFAKTDKAIRGVVAGELPRELASFVFAQVDETKNALVRVVAREVREFLEATDVAAELGRALTALSFEIKTEIRFIPNEAGYAKPKVRSKVRSKRVSEAPRAASAESNSSYPAAGSVDGSDAPTEESLSQTSNPIHPDD
ncbi:MAG: hypothetical protein AAF355_02550 [Myxococcota bacterium]